MDEITPLNYYRADTRVSSISQIRKESEDRIKENDQFKLIDDNAHRLKKQRNISSYSLNLEKYRSFQNKAKEEAEKYKDVTKVETSLSIFSLPTDDLEIQADSVKIETTKTWHKELKNDIYLEEAVKVLEDLI